MKLIPGLLIFSITALVFFSGISQQASAAKHQLMWACNGWGKPLCLYITPDTSHKPVTLHITPITPPPAVPPTCHPSKYHHCAPPPHITPQPVIKHKPIITVNLHCYKWGKQWIPCFKWVF
jgi:hypothetical protein